MEIEINIRGIDEKEAAKSDSIKNYVNQAIKKLENFLSKEQEPIHITVFITVIHPHPNHEVEVRVAQPRKRLIAKRQGPELYKVIDEVMDIAFNEVTNHKQKLVDERNREGAKRKIKNRSIKFDD
jgi:ribosome-associated translation inhibitor RaiA